MSEPLQTITDELARVRALAEGVQACGVAIAAHLDGLETACAGLAAGIALLDARLDAAGVPMPRAELLGGRHFSTLHHP